MTSLGPWSSCALFPQHLLRIGSESTQLKASEHDFFPLSTLSSHGQWREGGAAVTSQWGNLQKVGKSDPCPTSGQEGKARLPKMTVAQRNLSHEKNAGTRDHLKEMAGVRFKFCFFFERLCIVMRSRERQNSLL